MANIKHITLEESQYLKIELKDVIEIHSSLKQHSAQSEMIDSFYIKYPTKQDAIFLGKVNNSIVMANKAFAKIGMEAAMHSSNRDNKTSEREELKILTQMIETETEQTFDRLNTMSRTIPEEFQRILSAVWDFIKNKVYTETGMKDSEHYGCVNVSYLEDNHFSLVNELQQQATVQYLVFFMNFFAGLSFPRKF